MLNPNRIDQIVAILEAYAAGEIDLPILRVTAAVALVEYYAKHLPPDGGGGTTAEPDGLAAMWAASACLTQAA